MIELHDDFGNIATIEKVMRKPYNGATSEYVTFVLSLMAEDGFMYHRSCYDKMESLGNVLGKFSCGTWH